MHFKKKALQREKKYAGKGKPTTCFIFSVPDRILIKHRTSFGFEFNLKKQSLNTNTAFEQVIKKLCSDVHPLFW
jgi:hypothetical protein